MGNASSDLLKPVFIMLDGQPLGEYPELRQVFVFSPLQVQGWIAHMRDETDRWIHLD